MKLQIRHRTSYHYDQPVPYGLQQVRLTPASGVAQTVEEWEITVTGGHRQLDYQDHHGNRVSLIGIEPDSNHIEVLSQGVVQTNDTAGVMRNQTGFAPLWLFLRGTPLTEPGVRVGALVDSLESESSDRVAQLHELSARVLEAVEYLPGATDSTFTGEQALESGSGVCQDHAHIFLGAARLLGLPARYVSGYLLMEDQTEQAASHAWAEAWVDPLGWIGFDVPNGISPDERYVRVATGLDYRDCAPISGIRVGGGNERMDVSLQVQDQQQ